MEQAITLLIVDDHQLVRWGIRTFLATQPDFLVLGEAATGEEALRLAEAQEPQVVLMDLRMPGMGGVEAIRQMRARWPNIAVVILTTYNEDDLMVQGLQAGACGYLLKDCALETLVQALRAAARGEMLVQPEVMARILARAAQALSPPSRTTRARHSLDLTEREREVLSGVARGERSKEIALRLGISERTVGAYINTIFSKLGVDSRASAVAVALERGLLPRQS
ncbi:MAG TPA: response regulator transcription factor [Ktedonobacterales bacterium]|jgi:NarL family two-component system response regulator YdfI